MLLVGSRALAYYGLSLGREPKDFDVIATPTEIKRLHSENEWKRFFPLDGKKYVGVDKEGDVWEFEIAEEDNTAQQLLRLLDCTESQLDVASIYVCYALKMSHRYKKNSPHFLKTMEDIHILRKLGFGKILSPLKEWYEAREAETYNYGHPSLKTSKKNFFKDDNIQYIYDHDSIHVAIAPDGVPAYTKFKADGEEVFCSKTKFEALPYSVQLASVVEESCVLAIERSLVPYPGAMTPYDAFKLALEKVCTSISSGWWREFAWENYYDAIDMHNAAYYDYFTRFKKHL